MKKKTDDLERIDGVAIPKWAKILTFLISFVAAVLIYALINGWFAK